jgi:hypothetical protein
MKQFIYPLNLPTDHTDFVYFTHQEYRTNASRPGNFGKRRGIGKEVPAKDYDAPNTNNTISLYMPNSTPSVTNGNEWGKRTFEGPIGRISQTVGDALGQKGGVIDEFSTGGSLESIVEGAGKSLADSLSDKVSNYQGAVGQAVLGVAGELLPGFQSGNDILAFSQGKIFNPNVELLYQGPKLRAFNMSFNFFARSTRESAEIDNIIKEFKKWSAPDDTGEFLTVPHTWQVSYKMGGLGTHPKMNRFKKAALTSITVQDNTSSNMHTTFEDGTPSVTSVSLSFTEVDMVFRRDHDLSPRGF